jgi:hypothetical protein
MFDKISDIYINFNKLIIREGQNLQPKSYAKHKHLILFFRKQLTLGRNVSGQNRQFL